MNYLNFRTTDVQSHGRQSKRSIACVSTMYSRDQPTQMILDTLPNLINFETEQKVQIIIRTIQHFKSKPESMSLPQFSMAPAEKSPIAIRSIFGSGYAILKYSL